MGNIKPLSAHGPGSGHAIHMFIVGLSFGYIRITVE